MAQSGIWCSEAPSQLVEDGWFMLYKQKHIEYRKYMTEELFMCVQYAMCLHISAYWLSLPELKRLPLTVSDHLSGCIL